MQTNHVTKSDTMRERAKAYWNSLDTGSRMAWLDALAAFGQAERERAVKECQAAYRAACLGAGSFVDIEKAIVAVDKPEPPKWCEHCDWKDGAWYCNWTLTRVVATEFQFCPICGEAKPQ